MKSEIERSRHRRAVKMLGRLVLTTLGPFTLGLFLAAHSPPAHAVTITVFGTPGTPGVDGAPPTGGGGETQPRQRQRITTRLTLRARQAEPAVRAVPALLPIFPVLTEELAATPLQPPPRAQPMALAMASLPRLAQAAQVAQAARASEVPPQGWAAQAAMRRRMQ